MEHLLHLFQLVVGILGNANALFLYSAPILTFQRVIKKKSTEEFSCVPYVLALANCLLYTWYGLPLVSHKWENVLIVSINGLGIVLELSFIGIYLWFSPTRGKRIRVLVMSLTVILIFGATVMISVFCFHHDQRKTFVGGVGFVASIAMYASPLVVVRQVIKTKSVEFMPFYLSLFSFLAGVLWSAYVLLGKDLLLAAPNLVGLPLGIIQLVVYFIYRNNDPAIEQEGAGVLAAVRAKLHVDIYIVA